MYAILHRKCSYPKRAFANPMVFYAVHVDKGKSKFNCLNGSEMLAYKKQLQETMKWNVHVEQNLLDYSSTEKYKQQSEFFNV